MSRAVGIDFGTTNSVIAVMEGGEPVVIPNQRGERLTPSVVAFGENNEVIVGTAAKNQAVINFEKTIVSIKRKVGENYRVKIGETPYTAEQISSLIISKLKENAEAFIGEPVSRAIITVPAYFNDGQRNAVKKAGELAGLEVMRLINEPTAAALAYNMPANGEGSILVFDLGGGTFDVSILDVSGDVYEVMATRGDNRLGGDDFDARLVEYICRDFAEVNGINLADDRMALQKIREVAEQTKIELSDADSTLVNVPFISADSSGPKHLEMTITRPDFESLIADYIEKIGSIVDGAIEDAGISTDEIDKVALVGGSSRIPAIQQMLEARFPGRVIRNTNPDECVAVGAAIQAGIMSGTVKGLVLVDVTPLTLGIETENDIFVPIIERNTCIPTSRSRIFTTVADNQASVEVHVLQGERSYASRNYSLGKFTLDGIAPARRGEPRIDVHFDIDVNGIVHVSACDHKNGIKKEIEISQRRDISDDDIERIVQDAASHREEDEIFLSRIQLAKQARTLLELIKKSNPGELKDSPELAELVEYIENAINSNDLTQLRNAIETMNIYINEMQG